MKQHWHYKTTEPFFSQGKDITRRNFSREERTEVGILIREALQNALDARRADLKGPVRVVFKYLNSSEFDSKFLGNLFDSEYRKRLKAASGVTLPTVADSHTLVIEDFGTTGLLGDYEDFDADGAGENWNAFWHREGEGAKSGASNGGAGQGKITYIAQSAAAAVLALTVRSTDHLRLSMGRAHFLRDYTDGSGKKFIRTSYWTASDRKPSPSKAVADLDEFSAAFKLSRGADQSGLSIVIPFAKSFDVRLAEVCVMLDFYMPIAEGRLEVQINDRKIDRESIDANADNLLDDQRVVDERSCFTKAYRDFAKGILKNPQTSVTLAENWNEERSIPETAFSDSDLLKLRDAFGKEQRVAVTFPLKIRHKNGPVRVTSFDVFLESSADLERNEESFIRQDLLIGAETHVASGAFVQKTRSMTLIRDKELSDFLLSAEEPTHLKWNASLARDNGEYVAPDRILRSLRQAVPRLIAVLARGQIRKDAKSLARFFAKPSSDPTTRRRQTKDGRVNPPPGPLPPPLPPPPPKPRPFRIESAAAEIRIVPNGSNAPSLDQFPIKAKLEVAYDGLDQDPFDAYDPFDFDLAHASHPLNTRGIIVRLRAFNVVEFEITQKEFSLTLGGFDPNLRVQTRLSYSVAKPMDETPEIDADA